MTRTSPVSAAAVFRAGIADAAGLVLVTVRTGAGFATTFLGCDTGACGATSGTDTNESRSVAAHPVIVERENNSAAEKLAAVTAAPTTRMKPPARVAAPEYAPDVQHESSPFERQSALLHHQPAKRGPRGYNDERLHTDDDETTPIPWLL